MSPTTAQSALAEHILLPKLAKHREAAKSAFLEKHPHAQTFFESRNIDLGKIREHSAKLLTSGTLAGTLLLSSPQMASLPLPENPPLLESGLPVNDGDNPESIRANLVAQLGVVLPRVVTPLLPEQEKEIGSVVSQYTGIKAKAVLEGERLNHYFGYIGAEQHLPRFPGDTVAMHDEYQKSGVTPGKGAWGYFAWSQNTMTKEDVMREKYYVAVQTLYLPDWQSRLKYLRDWYKYRKVLVVNPKNGESVVAVIADAGPSAWTGKQFGGSPEVMAHLKLNVGMQKGAVLLFFVDDPDNKVPLGPVDYKPGLANLAMN